jgi:hypothetical protein
MTDDMLALARENQRQAGVTIIEFLKGGIENIPQLDNSVEVQGSNYAAVGNVSALRETSVLWAFVIGRLFLREAFTRYRNASASLLCCGAILLVLCRSSAIMEQVDQHLVFRVSYPVFP